MKSWQMKLGKRYFTDDRNSHFFSINIVYGEIYFIYAAMYQYDSLSLFHLFYLFWFSNFIYFSTVYQGNFGVQTAFVLPFVPLSTDLLPTQSSFRWYSYIFMWFALSFIT
nr:hypothetical protein Itr_chr06CG20190 [Ipomoea trifida]